MMSNTLPYPMTAADAALGEDRLSAADGFDVLIGRPEQSFDDIVELATAACNAPVALVGLVDDDRLWFKARAGFHLCEVDLNSSVCQHALDEPDLLIIPDLRADPRTRNNPLVTGEPHIRFYAGAPLRSHGGQVHGSVCVIDHAPRPDGLTAAQATVLRNLARQVMTLLEMQRVIAGRDSFIARRRKVEERLGASAARLRISEAHWRGLFERLDEGFIIAEVVRDEGGRVVDWRYLDVNAAWGELVGVDPVAAIGRTVREVFPGIEDAWVHEFTSVVETGEPAVFTREVGSLRRWYDGRAFALGEDRFAVLLLNVTSRVQAEIRRESLLEIGDRLRDLGTVEAMTRTACGIIGEALGVARAGFGRLDGGGEHLLLLEPGWSTPGTPGIAGRHRFADWGDVGEELLRSETVIVGDIETDPRTAGVRERWAGTGTRSLVGVPVRERGCTVAVLFVQDNAPRAWTPEGVAFLRNVADRLTAAVARVRAEDRQRLLNEELSHRMKNMLAMIQAIANQTLKRVTEQEAVEGFQARLLALSSAHDVLLQQSWTAAPMREVVEGVLGRSVAAERFAIDGPPVTLGPRATLTMSLLLHELATNAAKYGALSVPAGRVTVAWRIDTATNELLFTWDEAGGPPTAEPSRKGFGSRLIRSGLLGTGGVSLRYLSTGLRAEMRAGLQQVQTT